MAAAGFPSVTMQIEILD
jgi:hypothetical protein